MKVQTIYFENSWDKQLVLEIYDNEEYVVIERTVHHFEESIEVSEVVDRFQSEEASAEFLQRVHGYDFGFDYEFNSPESVPEYEDDPEWEEIPF